VFLGVHDVFFEAAAMLTTLSLIGHWLEMRSRFATGRAVEALHEWSDAVAVEWRSVSARVVRDRLDLDRIEASCRGVVDECAVIDHRQRKHVPVA